MTKKILPVKTRETRTCRSCGTEYSKKEKKCPECGAWSPRRKVGFGCLSSFLVLVVAPIVFVLIFGTASEKAATGDKPHRSGMEKKKEKIVINAVSDYRHENSRGGVQRVWVFYTNSTDPAELERHAKRQFQTSRGMTAVLYFNNREMTPNILYCGLEYPEEYDKYLIATYHHFPNGTEKFRML